jgi:hypothetical protein
LTVGFCFAYPSVVVNPAIQDATVCTIGDDAE